MYASSLLFYNKTLLDAAPAGLKLSDQLIGQSVLHPRHSDSESGTGKANLGTITMSWSVGTTRKVEVNPRTSQVYKELKSMEVVDVLFVHANTREEKSLEKYSELMVPREYNTGIVRQLSALFSFHRPKVTARVVFSSSELFIDTIVGTCIAESLLYSR